MVKRGSRVGLQILEFIGFLIIFILKTVTIDLFRNIKKAWLYSFYPEERKKMKRELEAKKKLELMNERLKIIERLIYAIVEDSSYLKSDKGKYDIKQLKKDVK